MAEAYHIETGGGKCPRILIELAAAWVRAEVRTWAATRGH